MEIENVKCERKWCSRAVRDGTLTGDVIVFGERLDGILGISFTTWFIKQLEPGPNFLRDLMAMQLCFRVVFRQTEQFIKDQETRPSCVPIDNMSSHASFPGEQLCSASLAASSVVEIVQNMYGDDLVVILYNSLQDAGELVSRIPELLSKWSSNDATATSVIPVKHRAQVSDLEDTEDPLDQGLLRSIPHADTCSADDSLFV
ncbi:Arginine repressor [Trichinella pseudospiralis]